jgi:NAD(P)-dependent dehydrogenase (short-subunit alcohol dehydrogenase family)
MSVAIITGGSRGLGLALAEGLVDAGWRVVVDGRDTETLAAAARILGPSAVTVPGDVTEPAHRDALLAAARTLGGPDLVVNNAGVLGPSPQPSLVDYPIDALRWVYEVNVFAPLAVAQMALPDLRVRGGALVNVTSDAAIEPYEGWGGYGSAKAAVEQASRVLAAEEPGVRVWWVDPGDLRTRMHQEAFPGEDISDRPEPSTVVPAFLRLLKTRPASGRIRLADLGAAVAGVTGAAVAGAGAPVGAVT